MTKKFKLLICGVGVQGQNIIEVISKADRVIARGGLASHWLKSHQIDKVTAFSLKADPETQSGHALNQWIEEFESSLAEDENVVYVTPFTPIMSDLIVFRLIGLAEAASLQTQPGIDFSNILLQDYEEEFSTPLVVMDGLRLRGLHHPPFASSNAILIHAPADDGNYSKLSNLLSLIFPGDHKVFILPDKSDVNVKWEQIQLKDLIAVKTPIEALFIPPLVPDSSLESFQEVIAHLRAPDGCPWDRKQTHTSLRTYLLEETYEALDALDKNDPVGLKEELGDILLQILLHAQIAAENHEFTLDDVITGINRKIVYRHPHVFKDWVVDGEQDVVQNWESLKGQERLKNGEEDIKGMLDGVPASFPALAQAQALQDRAARVGFDWPNIAPVMDKVLEELDEVRTAPNDKERGKELGDLLFAIVNLIRWHKVDAESMLRETNTKFRKRFAYIETKARTAGKEMRQMTLEEMDMFWEQAKEFDD